MSEIDAHASKVHIMWFMKTSKETKWNKEFSKVQIKIFLDLWAASTCYSVQIM